MAISIVQRSTRASGAGPSLTRAGSFSSTPTVGNWVVVLFSTGSGEFGTAPSSISATDNQGNTYTQRAFCEGADTVCAVLTAPITTASGTFTVTGTIAPSGADTASGITLLEVTPLDGANLVDILIQLNDQTSYSTTFDVTTAATDTADELVIAMTCPRGNGSFNASPSPAVPPSGYTTIDEVNSGNGAVYSCQRITTATGAQSINLSGKPIDSNPGMLVVSFRGAAAAVNAVAETVAFSDAQTAALTAPASRAESIAFTDAQIANFTTTNTRAESVAFTDVQTGALTTPNTRAESVAFTDGQTGAVTTPGVDNVNETVAFTHTQTATGTRRGTVNESIAFADFQTSNAPGFTGLVYGDMSFSGKGVKKRKVRTKDDIRKDIRKDLAEAIDPPPSPPPPPPLEFPDELELPSPTPPKPRVEDPEARKRRRQAQQRRLLLDED